MPASSLTDSGSPSASAASTANPTSNPACNDPLYPGVVCDSPTPAAPQPLGPATPSPAPTVKPKKRSGFVRFLHKIFVGS
jgi:hypothetical protein